MKKQLNKIVIIYEGTTSFDLGGVGRIIDFDKTSRGEPSYFVLPAEYDHLKDLSRLDNGRWVRKSEIKCIVSVKRPNKFIMFIKRLFRI